MLIARVIGDIVATQKDPSHHARKILLVQPLNLDGSIAAKLFSRSMPWMPESESACYFPPKASPR